jgi:hypothetical protein
LFDHLRNAPPRYSVSGVNFKKILSGDAKWKCSRCPGSGYIDVFKHVCAGRCFKCISKTVWEHAQEEFDLTCEEKTGCNEMAEVYLVACGGDGVGPAYLSDGMWITPDGQIYDAAATGGLSSKGRSSALGAVCLTA